MSYTQTILADGPERYYPLTTRRDEFVFDQSGNGGPSARFGLISTRVNTIIGGDQGIQEMSFDSALLTELNNGINNNNGGGLGGGVDTNGVFVPFESDKILGYDDFTLECLFRLDYTTSGAPHGANGSPITQCNMIIAGTYVVTLLANSGNWIIDLQGSADEDTPTLTVGTVYHFAAVYDSASGTMVIYLNGSQVASTNNTPNDNSASRDPFGTGYNTYTSGLTVAEGVTVFPGIITDVAFYQKKLTTGEISAHSAAVSSGTYTAIDAGAYITYGSTYHQVLLADGAIRMYDLIEASGVYTDKTPFYGLKLNVGTNVVRTSSIVPAATSGKAFSVNSSTYAPGWTTSDSITGNASLENLAFAAIDPVTHRSDALSIEVNLKVLSSAITSQNVSGTPTPMFPLDQNNDPVNFPNPFVRVLGYQSDPSNQGQAPVWALDVLAGGASGTGSPALKISMFGSVANSAVTPPVIVSNTALPLDTPVHVVVVFDAVANTVTLYQDGANVGSFTIPDWQMTDGTNTTTYFYPYASTWIGLSIGNSYNNCGFPGVIDTPSLYRSALTSSQVSNHYAALQPVSGPTTTTQTINAASEIQVTTTATLNAAALLNAKATANLNAGASVYNPAVVQWDDISGNNNTLLVDPSGTAPTRVENALNGMTGVSFDADLNQLTTLTNGAFSQYLWSANGSTVFTLQQTASASANRADLWAGILSPYDFWDFQNNGQLIDYHFTPSGGNRIHLSSDTNPHIWTLQASISAGVVSRIINIDGTTAATDNPGQTPGTNNYPLEVGGTLPGSTSYGAYGASGQPQWGGTKYEMIVFSRGLTQTEYQQVEGYLAWKWGIQANLPVGHPYASAPPSNFNLNSIPDLAAWWDASNAPSFDPEMSINAGAMIAQTEFNATATLDAASAVSITVTETLDANTLLLATTIESLNAASEIESSSTQFLGAGSYLVTLVTQTLAAGSAVYVDPNNAYANAVATSGPLRYYKLDESNSTAIDSSGNSGTSGTWGSSVTHSSSITPSDHTGGSATFPASADTAYDPNAVISFPYESAVLPSSGTFTFEFVATLNELPQSFSGDVDEYVLFELDPVHGVQCYITAEDQSLYFTTGGGLVGGGAQGGVFSSLGVPVHIVIKVFSFNYAIYINGTKVVQTGGVNGTSFGSHTGLRIGQGAASNSPSFPGTIDNLAIYNKQLSDADILAHATAGGFVETTATQTIGASSELSKNVSPSLNAAALLKAIGSNAIAAGSVIAAQAINAIPANATLSAIATASLTAASRLAASPQSELGAAATLASETNGDLAADAIISQMVSDDIQSAAVVSVTESPTADAASLISASQANTVDANSLILGMSDATINAGANVSPLVTTTATINAASLVLVSGMSFLAAAASILESTGSATINASAVISASPNTTIGAATRVAGLGTSTLGAATAISAPSISVANANSLLVTNATASLSAGSRLAQAATASANAAAIVLAHTHVQITAASAVASEGTSTLASVAVVSNFVTTTINAAAHLAGASQGTLAASARIVEMGSATINAGAEIESIPKATIAAAAVIAQGTSHYLSAAAYVIPPGHGTVLCSASSHIAVTHSSNLGAGAHLSMKSQTTVGAGANLAFTGSGNLAANAEIDATPKAIITAAAQLMQSVVRTINAAARIAGATTLTTIIAAAAKLSQTASTSANAGSHVANFGNGTLAAGANLSFGGFVTLGATTYVVYPAQATIGAGAVILGSGHQTLAAGAHIYIIEYTFRLLDANARVLGIEKESLNAFAFIPLPVGEVTIGAGALIFTPWVPILRANARVVIAVIATLAAGARVGRLAQNGINREVTVEPVYN